MHIRAFKFLGQKQLVALALNLPCAWLLDGWGAKSEGSPWLTLAVGVKKEAAILADLAEELGTREKVSAESELDEQPPFTSGFICILAYEAASQIESSLNIPKVFGGVEQCSYLCCDASLSTHQPSGKTYIYAKNKAAGDKLEALLKDALENDNTSKYKSPQKFFVESDVTQAQFLAQVQSIQNRILAGDFFQANLTRMLSVDLGDTSRFQLGGFAERFLSQSQAPFGAILNLEKATVISASPERFFRIEPSNQGRKIFAEPIKGTRPRHGDPELDEALKHDLLESEKDRAENIMIADLVRNDLSRACTDESIVADPICELRSYKNVHHLVTRVSGVLRDEVSNLDALLAQFPCGSITGAPKWAAMDAIAELEQRGRGTYCGAIGFFDDRGHADFSVAIRTAVASFGESLNDDEQTGSTTLTYGTGGGITILSDPEEEFFETEDKAAGFLKALQL